MALVRVTLGLGANLGSPVGTLARAVNELVAGDRKILYEPKCSALYRTDALLPPGAPESWNIPFFNFVLSGYTELSPEALLSELKHLERFLGRRERERWAPREIDLDILTFGSSTITLPGLSIPHPEMRNRSFVTVPMHEVEPELAASLNLPRGELAYAPAVEQRQFYALLKEGPVDLRCVRRVVSKSPLPQLAGIVNCTPDSFSNDGCDRRLDAAERRIENMLESGILMIDLGAESTRPGADPVSDEEEQERLQPVFSRLLDRKRANPALRISIDTRHPETAAWALREGADIINDQSGLTSKAMRDLCRESKVPWIVMHSLGLPASRERVLSDQQPASRQVLAAFDERLTDLEAEGISRRRLILDPGIGFGKKPAQSFELLKNTELLWRLGCEILIGHSRKSFLTLVTGKGAAERDFETALCSFHLAKAGADYLRVHAAAENLTALKLAGMLRPDSF